MEEKKEYYFSYERVHRWLNVLMSVSRASLHPDTTELSTLCSEIRLGNIGDYNEVEWNQFGINYDSIPTLLGENFRQEIEPCPTIEIVRVLVYWRDHAKEVLNAQADSAVVNQFEEECCKAIERLIPRCKEEYENQLQEDLGEYANDLEDLWYVITFGDKEYLKALRHMHETWQDYFASKEWKIISQHGLEEIDGIVEDMVFNTKHSPFPYPFIMQVAFHLYHDVIQLLDKETEPDLNKLFRDARGLFVRYSGRYISPKHDSITLALWLLIVLLHTDRDYEERKPEKNEIYIDLSRQIATQAEHLPHSSYSINWLYSNIDAIAKAVLEETGGEDDDKASSIAPNDSIFRANSMDYEMCKEKLLYILNNSSTKLEVCRKLRDQKNSLYFNMNQQNTVLARILNTWVPLITSQKNKKWKFKDDDFRKSQS